MGQHANDTSHGRLSRRLLMQRLAAAGFASPVIASITSSEGLAEVAGSSAPDDSSADLTGPHPIHDTPLDDAFLTPNDRFFARSAGRAPDIAPDTYRLSIGGLVDSPLELTLDDLRSREQVTHTAFLECSGNGLPSSHVQPRTGAIGNAAWTGTPLAAILAEAGVQDGAVQVATQGADLPASRRGLPLRKALAPDTILAWRMNGEDLPAAHGGPVRLLVPGWGGIASTKWLIGIDATDRVLAKDRDHHRCTVQPDHRLHPVRELPVKSVIVVPAAGDTVRAGEQAIIGYAWSGYGGIARVAVSSDGGDTWSEAEIVERAGRHAWIRFVARWDARPGRARLLARATDEMMLTQPCPGPWHARGYYANAVLEVPVTVTA